jgi:hypothetical protein
VTNALQAPCYGTSTATIHSLFARSFDQIPWYRRPVQRVPRTKVDCTKGGSPVDLPLWPHVGGALLEVVMEYSDYLRDQAAAYRRLAKSANDPAVKNDLSESAEICEMVADDLDDRRPAG